MNVNDMEKETNMGSSNNEDKDVLIERDGCNDNSCNEEVDRNEKNGSSEHAQKKNYGLQATSTEPIALPPSKFKLDISSATERSASFEAKMEVASDRKPPTGARLVVEIFAKTGERRWSVALSSLVVSILALLVGLSIAFPSNAVLDLQGDATDLPQDYLFSTLLLSFFAALAPVGAVFGGPFGGWIADCWGRKCSLLFCGVPYVIGYALLSYAHYSPVALAFKVILLIGRLISGFGMGWASAVVPVYIAEISSFKWRGIFGTLVHLALQSGVLLNYGLGSINDFPYYYISLVAVGLVAIFEIFMIWLPETPRWLLSRGYQDSSMKALKWFRGPKSDVANEINEIKQQIKSSQGNAKAIGKKLLQRNILVPFIYILITFSFVHLGGINVIEAFAGDLLSEAGVSRPRTTSIYAIGLANLVGIIVAFFFIEYIGRKILLISSGVLMAIGACMLGTHYFITRPSLCFSHQSDNTTLLSTGDMDSSLDGESRSCNPQYGPLAIISLILYNFSFSIGWGPVPWLLLSELLPLSVRGAAAGFAMITNYTSGSITNGFYLKYEELVHPWFALWTFSLTNLVSAAFVLIFIPETKGKSLEELERNFEKKFKAMKRVQS